MPNDKNKWDVQKQAGVLVWIAQNRGKMTEIAAKLKVSPQFVTQVLRRKRRSKDGRVERELRAAGAPVK